MSLLLFGCKKQAPPAPPPPKVTVNKPIQQEITEWHQAHREAVSAAKIIRWLRAPLLETAVGFFMVGFEA